tara:strand:- start:303 stop:1631 length:1329 start_codon:yes stop_codon:yes gene_type:complete
MRIELETAGNRIISLENLNFYNLTITLHGLLMIFFLVMPALIGGFGNIFIPILIGTSEVCYPRTNNISILLIPYSYNTILLSAYNEIGGGIGWTLYPPLSTSLMSLSSVGVEVIILGLVISGISTSLSSINLFATDLNMRCNGMTLSSILVYVYSISISVSMLLLVLPVLTAALIMLLADLHYNTIFFDPMFGGDPIFYQHLFWFFGHPEVYILILPSFGIISMILQGTYLYLSGKHSLLVAMYCISIIGIIVWVHHMFTVGLDNDIRAYFTCVTLIISLPTGSKIFNFISTYIGTNASLYVSRTIAGYYCMVYIISFTVGGTTGVILSNIIVDIALHDTYFTVTHFHFILSLGTIYAIFSGLSLLLEQQLPSLILSTTSYISRYPLFIIYVGIILTFTPMHFLGFNVMPRRLPDFPDNLNSWNTISSIGSGITLISFSVTT